MPNAHKASSLFKRCNCGGKMRVTDSRAVLTRGNYIRRRYECTDCGDKFSTAEKVVVFPGEGRPLTRFAKKRSSVGKTAQEGK